MIWVFPKIRGTPKMDGENNGKPFLEWMIFWGFPPYFSETSIFIHSQFNSSSHFTFKIFLVHFGQISRSSSKVTQAPEAFFCCPKKKEQPPKNPTNQAQPPTHDASMGLVIIYLLTYIYHRFMPNLGTLNQSHGMFFCLATETDRKKTSPGQRHEGLLRLVEVGLRK